jgi:hypothetical protein
MIEAREIGLGLRAKRFIGKAKSCEMNNGIIIML